MDQITIVETVPVKVPSQGTEIPNDLDAYTERKKLRKGVAGVVVVNQRVAAAAERMLSSTTY